MIVKKANDMAGKFPVIVVTGPRQAGKSTFAKLAFPTYRYVSLENPDNRQFAQADPRGFLNHYDKYVIFDEIQNVPELFSYLQQIVDESGLTGQFILSGSQNFLLLEKITQTLAGRVYHLELLPFSVAEITSKQPIDVNEAIIKGGYPRIYDKNIAPIDYFPSYVKTYVERDVRTIVNVQDLAMFQSFVQLCAVYAGQAFNASEFAKKIGVSVKTIQNWLSILEASYIVFKLKPWYRNLSKRLVKSPKLYFYDTGLLAYLLGIETTDELIHSPAKGALFENFALLEIFKSHNVEGKKRNFYYWRDSNGNEVDLIIEHGLKVQCVEMKYSQTVKEEFLKSLHYLDKLTTEIQFQHYLMNTQNTSQKRTNETIVSWQDADLIG